MAKKSIPAAPPKAAPKPRKKLPKQTPADIDAHTKRLAEIAESHRHQMWSGYLFDAIDIIDQLRGKK